MLNMFSTPRFRRTNKCNFTCFNESIPNIVKKSDNLPLKQIKGGSFKQINLGKINNFGRIAGSGGQYLSNYK